MSTDIREEKLTFIVEGGERPREEFDSGMVRDTTAGKVDQRIINYGPMKMRWIVHLDTAREHYPDLGLGIPNWTVGDSIEEFDRYLESAERHFGNWAAARRAELTEWSRVGHFVGVTSTEDEAAAVYFNINGAEYVRLLRKYDGFDKRFGPGSVIKLGPGEVPGG